jgi:single-stranded-DNA-specific exonuclease
MFLQPQWQVLPLQDIPDWFLQIVRTYTPNTDGRYAAQLLWQRGIRERQQLLEFIDPNCYQPTDSFAFGQEMNWVVLRLLEAREKGDKITIWGDFDADGITATSVLWEGLGQFFPQHQQLNYYIPNRLSESHGLNCLGLDRLAASGTKLIVTCDTGSTNLKEIEYANQLGIDVIVTDHHTLPDRRPPVVGIINPRYFDENHPLFHLSGVAVAYKLVEAVYTSCPNIARQPVEELLDLVAIGLIADLVQLSGDCRYLAQKGIKKLAERRLNQSRPGVFFLLENCQKNGDRPTDISYGLGPRINAVSRIYGEASFCVELLTSRDEKSCKKLAEETELANTRRKALQRDVSEQVKKKVSRLDRSTTSVIVLEDPQWQSGVLGLVAGQIAQEYGRPTILLSTTQEENLNNSHSNHLARGSARSANNINLYELVNSQAHLLYKFGGHPFAAGLSLPIENISLFREAIDTQLRQKHPDLAFSAPTICADLVVTIAEISQEDLGKSLFGELKLLEPCGMGNLAPKLLIKNCWFEKVWNKNIQTSKKETVSYLKTHFELKDDSCERSFPGIWWGHSQNEIPLKQRCDVIVELELNFNYDDRYQETSKKRYELRLIAVKPTLALKETSQNLNKTNSLSDRRSPGTSVWQDNLRMLQECPTSWEEIQKQYQHALANQEKLALAYQPPQEIDPQVIWQQLVGIAKYLSRTQECVTLERLQTKLQLSDRAISIGLQALSTLGFDLEHNGEFLKFNNSTVNFSSSEVTIDTFFEAVREEHFQRQYFSQIPLSTFQEYLTYINSLSASDN